MSDSVERFSNRIANYVKYRPHYPAEIIGYLTETCGLAPNSVVCDIGCGTGISSKLFLENGNRVIGVEPNAAMREAAAEYLADLPKFELIDGTSSETSLPENSIDMIVAAQAFHWFEPEKTRTEFHRILKPGGHIVLMWNERQLDSSPFLVGYEALLIKYAYDYGNVRHENIAGEQLQDFFRSEYTSKTFANHQDFDFDGIKGRLLSSSYMPNESDAVFNDMIEELRSLFAKHAENGRIRVLYDTNVYASQV